MNSDIARIILNSAIEQAEKSWNEGGIPIGAALSMPDGTIVATGHNERVQTGDPTAHAETVCFRNAGRRRDWPSLILATTLSPCPMCTGTAVLYGVRQIVIGESHSMPREATTVDDAMEMLRKGVRKRTSET